jgi:hypothetical protein
MVGLIGEYSREVLLQFKSRRSSTRRRPGRVGPQARSGCLAAGKRLGDRCPLTAIRAPGHSSDSPRVVRPSRHGRRQYDTETDLIVPRVGRRARTGGRRKRLGVSGLSDCRKSIVPCSLIFRASVALSMIVPSHKGRSRNANYSPKWNSRLALAVEVPHRVPMGNPELCRKLIPTSPPPA